VDDDCLVYGNYFRNTEGVRIYGDRHQVFSNYFEGNYVGIDLGNGAPDPGDGTPNSHDRPDNCVIAFNTFIDNHTHFQMSRRTPVALGATNTTFANNIIQGGDAVARILGPYSGAIWSGNLLWNAADAGNLPAEGYTREDPLLAAGSDGIKRLQSGSPAIGSAVGAFPAVTIDMDGRPRPEKKAKGANEFSAEPVTARFLSATDVGPNAP
jgi:poly(beta-D-mannuronate) lyase